MGGETKVDCDTINNELYYLNEPGIKQDQSPIPDDAPSSNVNLTSQNQILSRQNHYPEVEKHYASNGIEGKKIIQHDVSEETARQRSHDLLPQVCVSDQTIKQNSHHNRLYSSWQRNACLNSHPQPINSYSPGIPQFQNALISIPVQKSMLNSNLYTPSNNSLVPLSIGNLIHQTQINGNDQSLKLGTHVKTANKPKKVLKKDLPVLKYRDLSYMKDEEALASNVYSNMRGRSQEAFPVRLHLILERCERDGYSSIISWMPHGRAFKVHNEALFVENVMPKFFFQTLMTSFTRQLGMYGFQKIIGKRNVDKGAYFHELFLRSRPGLAKGIHRNPKERKRVDAENEPNLYTFKSMPFPSIMNNSYPIPKERSNIRRIVRYSDSKPEDEKPVILNVPPIVP